MFKLFLYCCPLLYIHVLTATLSDDVQEIAQRPVGFSIVREDSLQDLEIIQRYFSEEKIAMLMVASGGCTAAKLVADAPLFQLTIVDPNLAQIELCKLKIHLLTLPLEKRLEILGYLPMDPGERKIILQGLMHVLNMDESIFGNIEDIAHLGLDYIGRYEGVFEALRAALIPYQADLEDLFLLTDLEEQTNRIAPQTAFGQALDQALNEVMSQEYLVKIFGEKATANRVQDFSRHFAERTRTYLKTHLASSSPWLALMFLGHFHANQMLPWLTTEIKQPLPPIEYFHGYMHVALQQSAPESYHVIHLSNIIDWLSPSEAEDILALAYQALKPGGVVIIRQLNSTIDIPALGKNYEWDFAASQQLLKDDRSFFYRNFFLGFKPRPSLAPQVKALADDILQDIPIIKGPFFAALPTMSKEIFQATQIQFFFAVDYFSRPMSALIARLPLHKDRIDIIHNIVEEHGDFLIERYHSNTFKHFLEQIEIDVNQLGQASAAVNAFNYALMGVSANEDPLVAIGCNGMIEYAFSDISALIGQKVIERGWVAKKDLVHYNLHANLDKKHAEEFFKILEPYVNDPEKKQKIRAGLQLGAYIFNRLYEDLYQETL